MMMRRPGIGKCKLPRMKMSDPWRYQSSKWRLHYYTGGYCKRRAKAFACVNDGDGCKACLNESNYKKGA